jgi:putative aldouronate transport system substrate-binding protein
MTRISSGEIPDFMNLDPGALNRIGAVRDIPRDFFYRYAPGYMKYTDELVPESIWTARLDLNGDGKIMGIPSANITTMAGNTMVTRSDWMEAVGVSIPTATKYGYAYANNWTLAQVEDLLLRYRNNDPDGNGQKDTYGWNAFKTANNLTSVPQSFVPNVFGAFGVRQSSWVEKNGELVWANITPEYRQALKYLRTWYEKEIIDPEFVADMRKQATQKFANGQFGAYEETSAWTGPGQGSPVQELMNVRPEVMPVYLIAPTGPEGKRGTTTLSDGYFGPKAVGVKTSDEKLIKILQIIDAIHTDVELYNTLAYGWEGEHWKFDSLGFIELIPPWGEPVKMMEIGSGMSFVPMWNAIHSGTVKSRLPAWRITPHEIGFEMTQKLGLNPGFQPIVSQEIRDKIGDPTAVMNEFFFRAVTGEIEIDAEWDAYVQRWMREGGAVLTEDANAQWKASR